MTVTWPLIGPAPETLDCGPPTVAPDGGWTVTRHADVCAVLTHPDCAVPAAPEGPPGTLAWLRSTVSRFSAPDRHPARRAIGVAALARIDPAELSAAAARRTEAELDRAGDQLDVMARLARRVPLEVLAAGLGLADPTGAWPAVAAVAAAYHPGAGPPAVRRADRAVSALLAMSPPAPPEVAANRIGLLVQACDATAGLIGAAARHLLPLPASAPTADLLAEVLRLDPPVRATRRVTTAAMRLGGREIGPGSPLLLRFDAANRDPAVFAEPDRFVPGRRARAMTFGAGPRGCPGERHALALAAGVVDVLRRRCRAADAEVRHDPHPTLRIPTSLEVRPR
ncbi:Cytochrome P450 [Micromonospora rhizosphaerae]|uniref:Cytochrome P450 n=1 Tax=Micromonospora rhizosphaerae TaxID=568872 RepID=A0A1C6SV63_9ACTN|nr:cytochrome P450 [Micromonospora rhizosphaerae]SCL33279.1 Cytochrome P450 [Micromonospora rhizosphaerae]